LYSIETQLLELIAYREDLLAGEFEIDDAERKELIQVAEQRIQDYVAKEVAKVDGVASMLREFAKREAIEKEEAQRITARAKRWAERKERLESMCVSIMQSMGKDKLDGRHSTLALKKCPPSVEIAQPGLLPYELRRIDISVPEDLWNAIIAALFDIRRDLWERIADHKQTKLVNFAPMKAEIGKVLKSKEPCSECGGNGTERLSDPAIGVVTENCGRCGGTGEVSKGVPGCRLVVDKVRLEVS
jgi:hypothetical protein